MTLSYKEIIEKRRGRSELWEEVKMLNKREIEIANRMCQYKRDFNSDINTDLEALLLCQSERREIVETLAKMENKIRKSDRKT